MKPSAPSLFEVVSVSNLSRLIGLLRTVGLFRGHRYVLGKAVMSSLRATFGGSRLRAAELSIGNACQLRCAHCYATELTSQTTPIDQLKERVDAVDRLGCWTIMLVGGEPTLHRELEELVRYIRAKRILSIIFTNGQSLDRTALEALHRAGLFGVIFSAQGIGDRHDRFVGETGAYETLMTSLDEARDLGLFVSLNVTATHELLASGDFDRLSEIAKEREIPLKFNFPAQLGRYGSSDDVLLNDEEIAFLDQKLEERSVTNDMRTALVSDLCPAGHYALYVTDAGEVTPCAYIPISFGNVHDEPIEAIHQRILSDTVFSDLHRKCLVGEDRDFVKKFIEPALRAPHQPMRWQDHPARSGGR